MNHDSRLWPFLKLGRQAWSISEVLQGNPKTWGTSRENPLTGDQKIAQISGDDDDDRLKLVWETLGWHEGQFLGGKIEGEEEMVI